MAYNEKLADRLRTCLDGASNLVEKKMFGGIAFMVNDKMCLGVDKDDIMLRCEPEMTDELLSKKGAKIFGLTGQPMKGWLLVSPEGYSSSKDFDFWVKTAVDANKKISASVKKKK